MEKRERYTERVNNRQYKRVTCHCQQYALRQVRQTKKKLYMIFVKDPAMNMHRCLKANRALTLSPNDASEICSSFADDKKEGIAFFPFRFIWKFN